MRHFVLHILGITGFCRKCALICKNVLLNIVEKHVFIPFTNKKSAVWALNESMEMRGVEPLSERPTPRASTSVVYVLILSANLP